MKRKSKILAIVMICMMSLSSIPVSAADTSEEATLYERMREACLDGREMEDWVVEGRKQIADELGLTEYLDENAYLSMEYRNEKQMGKDGYGEDEKLDLLLERATTEETEMLLIRHMFQTFASSITHGASVSVTQERSPGNNSIFSASGAASSGYCAQNSKSYWSYGNSKTGTASEWNDATVRKILYYAPGGPGYVGPYTLSGKTSTGNDADHATFATGYQNGDSNNKTKAKAYIAFLADKPDPLSLGYKAYKIDIPSPYQDVAFLAYAPVNGYVQIVKKSSNASLTNGNPCYSLEGAEFVVYSSSSLSSASKVGTLKTNASGKTGTLSLNAGTYYVKETKSPKGFAIDTATKKITVTANQTTTVNVTNYAQMDPVGVLLGKVDAQTNENKPQGSATLAGAQFTVKYFGTLLQDASVNPETLGYTPLRTWVLETDVDGFCYLSKDYLVSGDPLYLTSEGVPSIPIGTITIQETRAPEGYHINSEIFVRRVTAEGTAEGVATYNQPIIKEEILELTLQKVNEYGKTLAGAEFTHIRPDGSTEVLTTDENGRFSIKGLWHGTHTIQESKAPEGYRLENTVFQFTIKTDNTITDISITKDGEPITGIYDYEITDKGNLALTVTNYTGVQLPATGSSQTIWFLTAGALLCILAGNYRKTNQPRKRREKTMMKHNLFKRVSVFMLATAIAIIGVVGATTNLGAMTVKAAANEISTPNGVADFQEGSTRITLYGAYEQPLEGKEFRVHRIFNTKTAPAGESINYTFVPEYEDAIKEAVSKTSGMGVSDLTEYKVIDYIQTMNHYKSDNAFYGQDEEGRYSDYRYFVETLRDAIGDAGIQGTVVRVTDTCGDNEVVLNNLAAGYYIIDEITAVEGTHAAASLCMADTSSDNYINVKSDRPTVVKKIYEDDGETGWNDIGDYEIGQTVPYMFESYIPDINGYHSYYYAWHDVMDEALTFDPGSVKITISRKIDRSMKDVQEYTLKDSEFEVKTNLTNGETFIVEVSDIKAIVDREFNNMNENGENKYYHKVVLEYNATLNDKAANDTGRPGFENDVKLEYSNDPDVNGQGKTGETPWDTVVCYTYKLNLLKLNSHDLQLEGAQFRLYSDEACENEVFVKKTTNGYNVINRDCVGGSTPVDAVEMISKADGTFVLYGLDSGTYYLKETKAPTGYRRILDPVEITLNATFTEDRQSYVKGTGATEDVLQELTATAHIKEFLSGAFVENDFELVTDADEGSMNLTVVNTEGHKLPATGSFMAVLCLGLGTALVTYSVYRKRKETKCES